MAADQSLEAEKGRAAALEWLRQSGLQMTGGSSAIPDTYEKLRVAGAVARETLKAAAARRSGAAVADIRTEAGHVILPDGTRIPYGALSAEAAKIPPVTNVKLRDPSQWRLIGKPMERLDIRAKVTAKLFSASIARWTAWSMRRSSSIPTRASRSGLMTRAKRNRCPAFDRYSGYRTA
jgi:isoquinoline 1-oxidoreductase beta subunit